MKNTEVNKLLLKYLNEALEDRFLETEKTNYLIIYEVKNNQKHFLDYEKAYYDPKEYMKILEPAERKKYLKAVETQSKSKYANIMYSPNERAVEKSIDEIIWIICCMLFKNDSLELKVIKYYIAINDINLEVFASEIGTTLENVWEMLNGDITIPEEKYKVISEALGFDMLEYFKEESDFIFDETDL